jgi:LmbE family N-acetylglucosaminyl deacetylase
LLKLLCITAHPDDEVGSFAGTLLHSARRGIETYIVCLTDGQAATHRGGAKSGAELGEMRRAEFAAACRLLKVKRGEVLNYPDGALDHANFFEVVGDLVKRIREIRPQVIVTLGTEGAVTAHPDHSMAAIFATMAFHWAGRTNRYIEQLEAGLKPHRAQKLYYATADFNLPDRQPVSLAPATAIIDVGDILETKIQAFAAHVSQRPLLPFFENAIRKRGHFEKFHLAAAITPRLITVEKDLFDGVIDEGSPAIS